MPLLVHVNYVFVIPFYAYFLQSERYFQLSGQSGESVTAVVRLRLRVMRNTEIGTLDHRGLSNMSMPLLPLPQRSSLDGPEVIDNNNGHGDDVVYNVILTDMLE